MEIKKGQIWRNVHGEVEVTRIAHITGTMFVEFVCSGNGHRREWGAESFLATHEFVSESVSIELIPTEKEKPVEQKYEVGGTLTLAEAIKAAKSGEIIAEAREGSRAVWKEQALRWEATGSTVHIHEYYLTGWRVVPKPVPMTRELQEELENARLAWAEYLKVLNTPEADTGSIRMHVGIMCTHAGNIAGAYQKAKESAK